MSIIFNGNLTGSPRSEKFYVIFRPGVALGDDQEFLYTPKDKKVIIPECPAEFYRPTKKFLGWTDLRDHPDIVKYHPGDEIEVDGPTGFYAVWEKEVSYNVMNYSCLGDTNEILEVQFTTKMHTIIDEIPVMTGYNFLGWSLIPNNEDKLYHAGDSIEFVGLGYPMNLFAVYDNPKSASAPYNITFKSGHGSGEDKVLQTDAFGKLTLPDDIFEGWDYPEGWTAPFLYGWSTYLDYPDGDDRQEGKRGYAGDEMTFDQDYILYANYSGTKWVTFTYMPWDAELEKSKVGDPCKEAGDTEDSPAKVHTTKIMYGVAQPCPAPIWTFDGYDFIGWMRNKDDTNPLQPGDSFGVIVDNVTFYGGYYAE